MFFKILKDAGRFLIGLAIGLLVLLLLMVNEVRAEEAKIFLPLVANSVATPTRIAGDCISCFPLPGTTFQIKSHENISCDLNLVEDKLVFVARNGTEQTLTTDFPSKFFLSPTVVKDSSGKCYAVAELLTWWWSLNYPDSTDNSYFFLTK